MGTSNEINLHKTFNFKLYFPSSLLEWKKQKMIENFELSFKEKNKTGYVINFKERKEGGKFFGAIWVNSSN